MSKLSVFCFGHRAPIVLIACQSPCILCFPRRFRLLLPWVDVGTSAQPHNPLYSSLDVRAQILMSMRAYTGPNAFSNAKLTRPIGCASISRS